jgi:hypothetical protein
MRRAAAGMTHMQHALLRALTLAPENASAAPAPRDSRREVVSVEAEPRQLDLRSGDASLTLTLRVGPDYHLNAHEPGVEGLIPTTLELENPDGLELVVEYPPGKARKYPFADHAINVYEGTQTIRATLRARDGASNPSSHPRLVLRYQVCTEMSCLEPRTEELPVTIES